MAAKKNKGRRPSKQTSSASKTPPSAPKPPAEPVSKAAKGQTPKKGTATPSRKDKTRARAEAERKAKMQRWAVGGISAVVILGLLGVSIFSNSNTGVTEVANWDLPAMGPTAEVQDRVNLAEFSGSPTVVNFFASWCVECDRELPHFATISEELDGQVDFVGIASQETGNPMLMPNRHGVAWWTLAQDVGGRSGSGLSEALGARGMPLTAFYDESGEFLDVHLGAMSEAQLRGYLSDFYGIG